MAEKAEKTELVEMEITRDEDGEIHVDFIIDTVPDYDGLQYQPPSLPDGETKKYH